MQQRKLGSTLEVSALGLGCMSLGIANVYTSSVKSDDDAVRLIHRSIDLGVTFLDTANIYGDSEIKLGKALQGRREKCVIATKFGIDTPTVGAPSRGVNGKPEYLRACCETSLKRLGIDTIDLYYAHRIDPNVPVEDMVGAMAELVKEGKVRYLGLSEASATSIRKAHAVHPIAALQSEYSLLTRDVETEILPVCRELGISLVPFSPLSRGLITNTLNIDELDSNDMRKKLPRFTDDFKDNNQQLASAFADLASQKNCTPAQLALAWVLAQGEDIIPIPGTKKTKYLRENAASVDIELSPADLQDIETIMNKYPNTGMRYSEGAFKLVNN